MLNTYKLFKQLKNGKLVQIFYEKSDQLLYTVWLTYKDEVFILHSFHFEGNDVFEESNYEDEEIENFSDFKLFCNRILDKFPGIESLTL